MSTTKQKILATSLKLFNERGVAQVKQRTIASALNISPGNLTYHFRRSADLIEAHYFALVAKTDEEMSRLPEADNLLLGMHQLLGAIIRLFGDYRFIFTDFMLVMRDHPKIKAHYGELLRLRRQQFLALFEAMVAVGYLRPPAFSREYESLYLRQTIMNDFWYSHQQFHHEEISEEMITECLRVNSEALFPYLTAKGREVFATLYPEMGAG